MPGPDLVVHRGEPRRQNMNLDTITVLGLLLVGVWMGELLLILWSYRASTRAGEFGRSD